MKRILIYQENVDPIEMNDVDDTPLDIYTNQVMSVLSSRNVTSIETTQGNLIVRPSKITSILVSETTDNTEQNINGTVLVKSPTEKIEEDVLTDE